nr:hypothetical protein [Alkalilacustris brevis]
MMSNAGCWRRRLAALAVVTSWLSGCAADGSDLPTANVCPTVSEYSREFHARAVEELELLPDGSVIAEMLVDYSVMRDQARICRARRR